MKVTVTGLYVGFFQNEDILFSEQIEDILKGNMLLGKQHTKKCVFCFLQGVNHALTFVY